MPTPPQSAAEPPPHRDPALDGLRGVAVLLVFLFHYGGGLRAHNPLLRALGYLTQEGWIGVDIFFALSGFLITGLLADSFLSTGTNRAAATTDDAPTSAAQRNTIRPALRSFYARRGLRILPLYFEALLTCVIAGLFTGATIPQLKPLLVYATFLQNLPPLLNTALHTPPPLPVFHLWSLAVEEQFYLLWPLALIAARTPRRALHLSLYTFVASCLFRAVIFAPHLLTWSTANSFATFLPTRAGALALGSALALYRSLPRVPQRSGNALPAASNPVLSTPAAACPVLPRDATAHLALSSDAAAPPVLSTGAAAHPVISTEAKRSGETPVVDSARARGTSQTATPLFLAVVSVTLVLLTALHTHSLLLSTRPAFLVLLPAADLLSAALVAAALSPNRLRSTLSLRPLVFLGSISYGFYVFHILLEPLFDHLGAAITQAHSGFAYQAARLLVALPLTTLTAWLSFTLLERPFLRLKRLFPRNPSQAGEGFST